MKITSVRTLVCNAQMRNWGFVRVDTDQPGRSCFAGAEVDR
jgi:galactonate dehydratase